MGMYTPDRWTILRMQSKDDSCYKILAGFYGGFAEADSWKLSSSTVEVLDKGDYYEFVQYSGSSYICRKNSEGMSLLTKGLVDYWIDQISDKPDFALTQLTSEEFIGEWHE